MLKLKCPTCGYEDPKAYLKDGVKVVIPHHMCNGVWNGDPKLKPTSATQEQEQSNEQIELLRSIKKNVQFFAWYIIIINVLAAIILLFSN